MLVPNLGLGESAVHPPTGKPGWEGQGWVDRLSQPHCRQVLACNIKLF